ncbi:MAG: class I SAM-dependent methyltransferase [Pseudomonadales bacterium]|nr:class I SAM-dependent methyltransferase [Pseudomonadales bacterium]MDP7360524.1 class I SAM-dependent methyltransferase [Pseudomonadales bacterium]MDP7597381.1 class I SAM-dependent methyltransferase [Pseudomonadales bacterium]HJN50404.1 class I SAM-dependent methyltransferase [Pseudomonadales bacterium]
MFEELQEINSKPEPFQFCTVEDLWTDQHTSKKMLEAHLDEAIDRSSRNRVFIEKSVKWIVERFEVNKNTSIADFGCGPGLYTTRLAENQASVTGIDFSERSVQYARNTATEMGLDIHYVQENYLEFDTDERFDLIIMIMCDYCALSPEQRRLMIEKFYSLLKTGGRVLLDVYSLNAFSRIEESASYARNQLGGFWAAEDYYGFLNTSKYESEKVALDKYTIFSPTGKRVVYNWLQYFSRESLQHEFEASGFNVGDFYADVAGSPLQKESTEMAVIAVKPQI